MESRKSLTGEWYMNIDGTETREYYATYRTSDGTLCRDKIYDRIAFIPEIKKVIFNEPATIIIWGDGTKTVVKCGENDTYDAEKGMAMAIVKKVYGNKGNYNNIFKKWISKYEEEKLDDIVTIAKDYLNFLQKKLNEEFGRGSDGE